MASRYLVDYQGSRLVFMAVGCVRNGETAASGETTVSIADDLSVRSGLLAVGEEIGEEKDKNCGLDFPENSTD